MRFDFENDLKQEIHIAFDHYGINLPIRANLSEYLMDYLTINKKLISSRVRSVKYNPEFLTELSEHPKKKEIDFLAHLFSLGKDVNFFQSRRLFQSNFHDHLAYEWNIYHFHLSLEKDKKSAFVRQVNQILFAYVNDDSAIFLGTTLHNDGIFGDVKWLEILQDHFPEIIEPFRDHKMEKVFPEVNGLERQILWDKGYTLAMTQIRNKVYHNPGVGRAVSGHSIVVGKTADSIMRWLYTINRQFEVYENKICSFLGLDATHSKFHLRIGLKTFEIVEVNSNLLVLSYPETIDESAF